MIALVESLGCRGRDSNPQGGKFAIRSQIGRVCHFATPAFLEERDRLRRVGSHNRSRSTVGGGLGDRTNRYKPIRPLLTVNIGLILQWGFARAGAVERPSPHSTHYQCSRCAPSGFQRSQAGVIQKPAENRKLPTLHRRPPTTISVICGKVMYQKSLFVGQKAR